MPGQFAVRFASAAAVFVVSILIGTTIQGQQPAFKAPPAAFADPDRRAKLARAFDDVDRIMRAFVAQAHVPGASWGVIVDKDLAHVATVGYRDVISKTPVERDTAFRIASMTKSFTAISILKLRDEGKLSLDDPAEKYVPEMARLLYPTSDSPRISIRHLLSHSEGFPEDNPWGDRQLADTDAELSRMIAGGIPFSNAPGVAYEYSNYGFAILGRIVANISDRTSTPRSTAYERYVAANILTPLGMNATTLEPSAVPQAKLAFGYRWEDDQWKLEPILPHGAFGAMGGMTTTVPDLARYVALFLDAWPPRDGADSAVLSRASLREMQQLSRPNSASVSRTAAGTLQLASGGYGFGLGIQQTCTFNHVVAHGGGLPGYGTIMRWLPDYGVGIIAFGNLRYTSWGAPVTAAFEALAATGGLEPRVRQPSPALSAARDDVSKLVVGWNDSLADRIAAANLFLDRDKAHRKADIDALRSKVGTCAPATGFDRIENALRGDWTLKCERGGLKVAVTLAPTMPPKVQFFSVRETTPADAQPPMTCPR